MNIVHLTSSTCFGGPERQMLGLGQALDGRVTSRYLSFAEGGKSRSFISMARRQGFESASLERDTPYFRSAIAEVTDYLTRWQTDLLLCHGYKANLLGRWAARRAGIPVVSVSRGWTSESLKVRLYEKLDRFCLRWMDRVICVSAAQSDKVRRAGVRDDKIDIIPNAIDTERFTDPDPIYQKKLSRYFREQKTRIVGAAGRLSPEKGFSDLLEAAESVLRVDPSVGFVLFGDGPCRSAMLKQISALGLTGSFVLCGFRNDLDKFMPFFDLFVLPSYTEGMPNVILESFAAGVPVVATNVGGTPELVEEGTNGYLVQPGDVETLADRICDAFASEGKLRDLGLEGREKVLQHHTFEAQAELYLDVFDELLIPAMPPMPKDPMGLEPTAETAPMSNPGNVDPARSMMG